MHDQTGDRRHRSRGTGQATIGSALRWATATTMFAVGLAKVLAVLWTPRSRPTSAPRLATMARPDNAGPAARQSPTATTAGL